MKLNTLMGDYPVTEEFKRNTARFDFADVSAPATAFKRVVRDLEFDVAELAIVTFLLAKAHGKPLRLLPAVVMARFQHPYLVFCPGKNPSLKPEQLAGKRVGVRSYSVTTGAWIRGILAVDHGVDIGRVKWLSFEEPHVAEFRDPPNVERAPAGKEMVAMLLAGELDAAIVGAIPTDGRLQPLIRDPEAAAKKWRQKHGAIQINHMVVVKNSVTASDAENVYELLKKSRAAAGNPEMNPFGVEENRRNLEVAIDCLVRQKMVPRRFSVEELFE